MNRLYLPQIVAANYFQLDDVDESAEPVVRQSRPSRWQRLLDAAQRRSLIVFAFGFLLIAGSAIVVGADYWSARFSVTPAALSAAARLPALPSKGPNGAVASAVLPATLQKITSQPLSLTIAGQAVPFDPATIKSWVKVVTDKHTATSYLHVDQAAIAASVNQLAKPFSKTPVDQVTATYADGSSAVIVTGHDGTKVTVSPDLAKQIAATVLGAKGLQLLVPTEPVAFAALTPASFDKLLEVNVTTKQMWAYDKGQLTRQFAISAGAPATPTPLGQYKIYEKLTVQDMTGLNVDGTPYLQPHVHWINYFLPGGYAVHGNYWRPLSAFGAVNTSHGCVSLPDDQAEWVYDWAPVGTTVITHA